MKCKKCGQENAPLKKTCTECHAFLEGRAINNMTGETGYRTAEGGFIPDEAQPETFVEVTFSHPDFEEDIVVEKPYITSAWATAVGEIQELSDGATRIAGEDDDKIFG